MVLAYGGCAPKDAGEADIAAGKVPCAARVDPVSYTHLDVYKRQLRNRIAIEDGTLRISAGLHRHKVAVEALDLAAARIVDLRQQPTLRPLSLIHI